MSIAEGMSPEQREAWLSAFAFTKQAHAGQIRKSGDPYLIHPASVAIKLWERFHDIDLAMAGLLHDTVEDCTTTIATIYEKFGPTIGFLVDALTKDATSFHGSTMVIEDRTERLLWAGMQDIRALLIKIADREHNINTLKYLKTDKQVRIAFETQAIYEPLKIITKFYESQNVEETTDSFNQYLHDNNITEAAHLKQNLYSQFFKDFNPELYDLVYSNSDKVVWEIQDKECFEKMLKSDDFERFAKIHSMWTDGNNFRAIFTFDKGYVMGYKNTGLRVASYSSKQ